ncbi:MAG TPA: hypothetical protein VHE81_13445 [Lacipirellulaceae bacterium]|nr:hypothetical protein [Lacipirellulaceae bacterium]
MFQNRQDGFVPNIGPPPFTPRAYLPAGQFDASNRSPLAIQVADIYQAAVQRAIEDHEIDKLFNAEFFNRKG